jgi:hypothetical protein
MVEWIADTGGRHGEGTTEVESRSEKTEKECREIQGRRSEHIRSAPEGQSESVVAKALA